MKRLLIKVERFLYGIWINVSDYFKAIYDDLRLSFAIKLADSKQQAYNKRYYVIPDSHNKLTVINNDDIKLLKEMKLMNKNATHLDVMRECIYYTPLSRNEEGNKLSPKDRFARKSKWLKYMESYHHRQNEAKLRKLNEKYGRK